MSARAPVDLSIQRLTSRIERRFLHFIESVPDAMILSDTKGLIVLVNTNTERLLGYSRDELMGKEVEILVPERFRTCHREDRATYYAHPTTGRMGVGRILSACRKDGVEICVEISLAPVEIKGKPFVWSAIRDISDRERDIAQIREALQERHVVLQGLICICAWCKRVRDGAVWRSLDVYVSAHLHIKFSHGICKDCLQTLDRVGQKFVSYSPSKAKRSAEGGPSMATEVQTRRYMVVEHIKDADAVYQRLWDRGRQLPNDLILVSVWFDENVERGYRLMETHDRRLLDEWMANWDDLIEFETYPVITPEEAGEKVAARMRSSTSRSSAGPVLPSGAGGSTPAPGKKPKRVRAANR
jgi:PAS domain S-box-containing protein